MRAELTDLGDGVTRVTMPLPWALDHVHCYAVAGDDDWTVIDAGLGSGSTLRWWEEALAELGDPPSAESSSPTTTPTTSAPRPGWWR